jgi:hypothetical protein
LNLFITQIASAKYSAAVSLVPEFFAFLTAFSQVDEVFCPDPLRLPGLGVALEPGPGLCVDELFEKTIALGFVGFASALVAAINRVAICKASLLAFPAETPFLGFFLPLIGGP